MITQETFERGERIRGQVAYLRICLGLTLKEVASRIGLSERNVDYYWDCVKRKIQGRPPVYTSYRKTGQPLERRRVRY